ncbi:hypothetical protein [Leptospira tipperaryensis]|uniref:hypothetical protein n=1 Tax=Leptospira tipperaryensis TaxID=2564040 RepID=UPI0012EA995D|nr:hypothetical protein [Leptospira tipperaryensis]
MEFKIVAWEELYTVHSLFSLRIRCLCKKEDGGVGAAKTDVSKNYTRRIFL